MGRMTPLVALAMSLGTVALVATGAATSEAADSTGTTERVSIDNSGSQANLESSDPAISADGRFVAFMSSASNLVAVDTNGLPDVFVRDRQTDTTERVSVPARPLVDGLPSSHQPINHGLESEEQSRIESVGTTINQAINRLSYKPTSGVSGRSSATGAPMVVPLGGWSGCSGAVPQLNPQCGAMVSHFPQNATLGVSAVSER